MKKLSLAAICAVVLILVVVLSAPAHAYPDIDVWPMEHDFEEVPLNTS